MKFSVFSVAMPEFTIEEAAKKLNEFGYDGIEIRVCDIPDEVKKQQTNPSYWDYNKCNIEVRNIEEEIKGALLVCNENNIEICALATYLTPDKIEDIEKVLKAASSIGCPRIRGGIYSYSASKNYNDILNNAICDIKEVEKLAKKYNVKVNFEMHHGTIIPSASAAYRLVSNFDPKYIGVIYDTGNIVFEGLEQHKMALEILGEYLDHVHIKNAKKIVKEELEDGTVNWQGTWATLKDGQINLRYVMKVLKEVGYTGYISFEDFSDEDTTENKLKNDIQYIKNMI